MIEAVRIRARRAAVAGQFYAAGYQELREQMEDCYLHEVGPRSKPELNENGQRKIIALIVPHAGYPYSGPVAAHAYKALAADGKFGTAVMLGPNHTGYGAKVSIWAEGEWETPLGRVKVDKELAHKLLEEGGIKADEEAHIYEHSIEVQLPWLQHIYGELKIVPIAMLAQDLGTARRLGKTLSRIGDNDVIIATTDFTHYESQVTAVEKDKLMIDAILELDEEKLFNQREALNHSMCGYGPVASAIVAAKERGAKEAKLLKYATSGDTSGDFSRVVGYGALIIIKSKTLTTTAL